MAAFRQCVEARSAQAGGGRETFAEVLGSPEELRRDPDAFGWYRRTKFLTLEGMSEGLEQEQVDLDRLLAYDGVTLRYVRDRLCAKVERVSERVEGVFGVAARVGFFPTLAASGVAMLTGLKGTTGWISAAIAIFTLLLWFCTYVSLELQIQLSQLRSLLNLLEHALDVRERGTLAPQSTVSESPTPLPGPGVTVPA